MSQFTSRPNILFNKRRLFIWFPGPRSYDGTNPLQEIWGLRRLTRTVTVIYVYETHNFGRSGSASFHGSPDGGPHPCLPVVVTEATRISGTVHRHT